MSTTVDLTSVEKTVIDMLAEFGVDRDVVVADASFSELGVDSLDLAELSQAIEEEYGVRLTGEAVKGIQTVGDLVALVVSLLP